MKTIHTLAFALLVVALSACEKKMDMAKYKLTKADSTKLDLVSYPEARKAVMDARMADKPDKTSKSKPNSCADDHVAVGPEGMRSIGFEQWDENRKKAAVTFKKVELIPGSMIARIYNEGKTAVLNYVVNVTLDTPAGEINLNVCRLETYINKGGQWCMVAGQGTQPVDFGDVFLTQVLRIVAGFAVGLLLMFLVMWQKLKKARRR